MQSPMTCTVFSKPKSPTLVLGSSAAIYVTFESIAAKAVQNKEGSYSSSLGTCFLFLRHSSIMCSFRLVTKGLLSCSTPLCQLVIEPDMSSVTTTPLDLSLYFSSAPHSLKLQSFDCWGSCCPTTACSREQYSQRHVNSETAEWQFLMASHYLHLWNSLPTISISRARSRSTLNTFVSTVALIFLPFSFAGTLWGFRWSSKFASWLSSISSSDG